MRKNLVRLMQLQFNFFLIYFEEILGLIILI
jgi:hypothetical protein